MEAQLPGTDLKRLSITMANYNHGHYLQERLSSLLAQMGPSDELIIVDDASTDQSLEIIASFTDPRLRFLRNETNKGVVFTAEKAVNEASGEFLLQVAADDIHLDGFIDTAMKAFAEYPKAELFCSDYTTFNDAESPETTYQVLPGTKEILCLSPEKSLSLFQTTPFRIAGHTVIVRRATYLHYGALDASLGPYSDWFLWHTIALTKSILYAPSVFARCRLDGNNFSKKANLALFHKALLLKLCERDNSHLKKKFQTSSLLYPFVRKKLSWGLKYPCLWPLFCSTIFMYTGKKWRRSLTKRLVTAP